jgi:hypothetical protein
VCLQVSMIDLYKVLSKKTRANPSKIIIDFGIYKSCANIFLCFSSSRLLAVFIVGSHSLFSCIYIYIYEKGEGRRDTFPFIHQSILLHLAYHSHKSSQSTRKTNRRTTHHEDIYKRQTQDKARMKTKVLLFVTLLKSSKRRTS